ncbi:MAG: hypothetical protein GF307_10645 [candidate division Zixibacteria bacterium]|nr:hypothetical protein [candidate division Zixibacteria bacterium]
MKNKILAIVIFVLSLAILFSCGSRENNPVSVNTDTGGYTPGANPAGSYDIITAPSGGPFALAEGMAVVDHTDPDAVIFCEFATALDTVYADSAIIMITSSGDTVDIDFGFGIGTNTTINITPAADLSYNTTYILMVKSAMLKNKSGDLLDIDGDGIGGETPDDDLAFRFTTHYQGDDFDDFDLDDTYDNLVDSNGDHVWETSGVGEAFTDERPYNNRWDSGESYTDANGNGVYDRGERYFDNNNDSTYNSTAEPLVDSVNRNGWADLGEFFIDSNNDSTWNDEETYTDANGNGEWDDTELRYDHDGDGLYDPADGDTYSDTETVNGMCDYAEAFVNADNDSAAGPARDSTGVRYQVPHWDDAEDVNPLYDHDNDGEYDAGVFMVPAGAYAFDTASVGRRLVHYNGNWQNMYYVGFSETFTDSNSDSVWNPADTFEDHIANGIYDAIPETLLVDVDSDGQYDAPEAGTPVAPTDDNLPPAVVSGTYYLINGNTVSTVWLDVTIAVDIADSTYDASGNKIQQALPSGEFDSTTVVLRDQDTKTMVPGTVGYDNISTSQSYLRLSFDPESNLAAAKTYELVLKAEQIADTSGNKLHNTGDVIYTFTTSDRTSDGSVIVDDTTPPNMVNYTDNGNSFTVNFSEELDVSTINAATIVVTWQGSPNAGSYVIERYAEASAPTGFAHRVTFYPLDTSRAGDYTVVKGAIKDLAGNRIGTDTNFNW